MKNIQQGIFLLYTNFLFTINNIFYRLYETQVKKIVKVQAMMRAFLAKRNFAAKIKFLKKRKSGKSQKNIHLYINKHY